MASVEDVTSALENARVSFSGVTFAGKALKLNTEEDAQPIVDAINKCENLQYLNMEGNTLGVEAATAIARALEKHPEFKQALWKDMFTGRLIPEIPKALESLGNGLMAAAARLSELDLSDNAFGPIGVRGLVALLSGPACYSLEILRLNNNGLGSSGGQAVAQALRTCHANSSSAEAGGGRPLALKVFVAGRNRLENEGAEALSGMFELLGSLEEISMPQNGIRHPGIGYLSASFMHNPNLRVINLNDNLIGAKAAPGLAKAMKTLAELRTIDFGDCLLKTSGAVRLAGGLSACAKLEEVLLSHNQIRAEGATVIINALANNNALKKVVLDGNCFGTIGREEIRSILKKIGRFNTLGSLSEDESPDDDDSDSDPNGTAASATASDEDPDEDADEEPNQEQPTAAVAIGGNDSSVIEVRLEGEAEVMRSVTAQQFVRSPNADHLLWLGEARVELLVAEAAIMQKSPATFLDTFLPILMKVSALSACNRSNVSEIAKSTSTSLYKHLFTLENDISLLNTALLIHLGLIKCEDKTFKPTWNLEGCLLALEKIADSNFVPRSTKDTLSVFLSREVENDALATMKARILPKLK